MTRFSHAYSLGFELESDAEDGSDVTHEMLRAAIDRRLEDLERSRNADPERGEDLRMACDAPWDTYPIEAEPEEPTVFCADCHAHFGQTETDNGHCRHCGGTDIKPF